MLAWAVGKLGMSEEEFYDSSYNVLTLKIGAYLEKQSNEWEKIRYLACTLINVNLPKGKQITPEKLMQLPTDAKPSIDQQISELLNNI